MQNAVLEFQFVIKLMQNIDSNLAQPLQPILLHALHTR